MRFQFNSVAPEFEIEYFLSRKKKTVIMEIRVQLEDRTQVAQPGYGYGYAYTVQLTVTGAFFTSHGFFFFLGVQT